MYLITPEARNRRSEFHIYTFTEAYQGEWKVSSIRGVGELHTTGDRKFILSDAKPNIFGALSEFLQSEKHVSINNMAALHRRGGVHLYLTVDQFRDDNIDRIEEENNDDVIANRR